MGHKDCPFPDRNCMLCSFYWLDGCVLCLKIKEDKINKPKDNTFQNHIYFGSQKEKHDN